MRALLSAQNNLHCHPPKAIPEISSTKNGPGTRQFPDKFSHTPFPGSTSPVEEFWSTTGSHLHSSLRVGSLSFSFHTGGNKGSEWAHDSLKTLHKDCLLPEVFASPESLQSWLAPACSCLTTSARAGPAPEIPFS